MNAAEQLIVADNDQLLLDETKTPRNVSHTQHGPLLRQVRRIGEQFRKTFWIKFEEQVRAWARESDDLYVYTGPLYVPDTSYRQESSFHIMDLTLPRQFTGLTPQASINSRILTSVRDRFQLAGVENPSSRPGL